MKPNQWSKIDMIPLAKKGDLSSTQKLSRHKFIISGLKTCQQNDPKQNTTKNGYTSSSKPKWFQTWTFNNCLYLRITAIDRSEKPQQESNHYFHRFPEGV